MKIMSASNWYKLQMVLHNLGLRSFPWQALTDMRVEIEERKLKPWRPKENS